MPRNTKENAELTRQHLLKVAQKMFAEQGIGNTSLDQIAKAANVTRGAIYWHFRDKSHLLSELYQLVVPLMQELRAKLISEGQINPPLAIWYLINRILACIRDDETTRCVACIVLLRDEGIKSSATSMQLDVERQKSLLRAFTNILGLAAERGQLQPGINISSSALSLQASMRGIISMRLSHPHYFSHDNHQMVDLMHPYFRGVFTPTVWQEIKDDKNY